jgi:hypothetical protein
LGLILDEIVIISILKNSIMKQRIKNFRFGMLAFSFLIIAAIPVRTMGKPSVGILPVIIRPVSPSVLNDQQALSLAVQLQDYFSTRLNDLGTISKLSREHILLLLKEVPAPDPENLKAESYKVISKKENLTYFLKCTIESIQVQKDLVQVPVGLYIVEGNSGKIFWEKKVTASKGRGTALLSEHILLNEIIKPALEPVIVEINTLKL